MNPEFKKTQNSPTSHRHEPGEVGAMSVDELRQHLILKHGWGIRQAEASRSTEDYMRSWHRNDHVPLKRAQ